MIEINPHLYVLATILLSTFLIGRYINHMYHVNRTKEEKLEIVLHSYTLIFIMAITMYHYDTRIYGVLAVMSGLFSYMLHVTNETKRKFYKEERFNQKVLTSYPNPKRVDSGFMWTDFSLLAQKLKKRKGAIFINQPIIHPNWYSKISIPKDKRLLNAQLHYDRIDFTRTAIVVGSMGSGKTAFFQNILNQNIDYAFFSRQIINDVKGDFTQKYYNPERDFIYNPFDKRSCYFDIWEEMKEEDKYGNTRTFIGKAFIQNIFFELVGKERNSGDGFWTAAALQPLTHIFLMIHYTAPNATSSEKWDKMLLGIESFRRMADNNTDKSLAIYLDLTRNVFNLLKYQSQQKNNKRLRLDKFLEESKSTLFFTYGESDPKLFVTLFTGTIAALITALTSRPDNENLSLFLLDEFRTMKFSPDSKRDLLTLGRSRGLCTMLGMQYLATDDESKKLEGSSTFAKFLFKVDENDSLKSLSETLGSVEYTYLKRAGEGYKKTYSQEVREMKFLSIDKLQNMPKNCHITIADGMVYLAKSPFKKLPDVNEAFVSNDVDEFYKELYHNQEVAQQAKKQKKVHTQEEKERLFNEFMNLTEEDDSNANLINFIKRNNLENENLDEYFELFF